MSVATSFQTAVSGEFRGGVVAEQLPNISCCLVKFKASASNTGNVYLGGSGVTVADGNTDTTTGLQLAPGDDSGWLPVDNLNKFYRISDTNTDNLTYLVLR